MTLQTLRSDTHRALTAAEAAELLGVSKVQVLRIAHAGVLAYERPFGDGPKSPYAFQRADVERLVAIRSGEIGDVLDRIDVQAAAADPTEDRNAYVRAAWLAAVAIVTKRTGGTFFTGQLRAHLPEDARGHAPGGFIAGLVRSHTIEHTGDFDFLNDPLARHGSTPCKVYRVIGTLA